MKNSQILKLLPALVLVFMAFGNAMAQKLKGKPENYNTPKDYFDQPEKNKNYQNDVHTKGKKDAWLVISDRADNPVYSKPNGTETTKIGFREYFYVSDEEEGWIKIVECNANGLEKIGSNKDLGWVPKDKMLLWTDGLVDERTNIHKKVLLHNDAQYIDDILKMKDVKVVPIFKGPNTTVQEDDKNIFEFFFVMKKEGSKFLLAKNAEITAAQVDDIVGWVDERRCGKWDNRICLEPNFDKEAFAERKGNSKLIIRAFKTESSARKYAEGTGGEEDVFWAQDPVKWSEDDGLARSNPRRYNGYVMRFPLIRSTSSTKADFEYYETGIIGDIKTRKLSGGAGSIDEDRYSRFKEYIDRLSVTANNINIFFVVEATDSVYAYRPQIVQAIQKLKEKLPTGPGRTVKFGALLYRDILEETATVNGVKKGVTSHIALTTNEKKVIDFLNKDEFQNRLDRDPATAMYYGLNTALKMGDFQKDEMNIIIMVGCYGDLKFVDARVEAAKSSKHPALIENAEEIITSLNKLRAHIYSIQLRNDETSLNKRYVGAAQYFIHGVAKKAYTTEYGNANDATATRILANLQNNNININPPSMDAPGELKDIWLEDAPIKGRIVLPGPGENLSPNKLVSVVLEDVTTSVDHITNFKALIEKIYNDGISAEKGFEDIAVDKEGISAGGFEDMFARWLYEIAKDRGVDIKDIEKSLDSKYKLFTKVYIPRMIQDAKHPTVSYVLFMPESELVTYFRSIKRSMDNAESSKDKRREQLYEVYKELLNQFTGEGKTLRDKKMDDVTRADLAKLMQGVYESGLKLSVENNIILKDILNPKKVSDDQVEELFKRFKVVMSKLDDILREGSGYEFSYKTDEFNTYYWIPLEDAF